MAIYFLRGPWSQKPENKINKINKINDHLFYILFILFLASWENK